MSAVVSESYLTSCRECALSEHTVYPIVCHSLSQISDTKCVIEHIVLRAHALYSMVDGFRQGNFFVVGEKKIKNKICWQVYVGGKKKIKIEIDQFLVLLTCFLPAKPHVRGAILGHVGGENIKKAELSVFFSCRTWFQHIGGLVNHRI